MGLTRSTATRASDADVQMDSAMDVEDTLDDTLVQSTLQTKLTDDILYDMPPDDEADIAEAVSKVDKKLGIRLTHLYVSKKDVNQTLDVLLELDDAQMSRALEAIHGKGQLVRLIKKAPKSLAQSRPQDMLRMYRNAPVPVLVARCKDLLKLKLFRWAISNGSADIVLDILAMLPQAAREQFLQAENGRYYDQLMFLQDRIAAKEEQAEADAKAKKEKEEARAKKASEPKEKRTIGEHLGHGVKAIGNGAKFVGGKLKQVGGAAQFATKALVLSKADLNDAQTMMGGSVKGAELDESEENTVSWKQSKWGRGLLHLDMPNLAIKSFAQDGMSTGAIQAKGFTADAKWRTKRDPDTYMKMHVDSLSLGDVTAKTDQGEFEIKSLGIDNFSLKGEDAPITQARPVGKGEAFKLIIHELGSYIGMNLPALRGALMGGYNKPESFSDRLAAQFGADMDVDLDVEKIRVGEVLKDGESVMKSMDISGIHVDVDDALVADLLQEKVDALEAKEERTELEKRELASLKTRVSDLRKDQGKLESLEALCEQGKLSRVQQDELIELRNNLKVGQAILSVESIESTGADYDGMGYGSMSAENLKVRATGGTLHETRSHRSRRQKLDDLIGTKYADAKKLAGPKTRELEVSGTVGSFKTQGTKYSHKEDNDTRFDLEAGGIGFGMKGNDLSLSAEQYAMKGLAYDPYDMKLNELTGEKLKLNYDMSTSAVDMSSDNTTFSGMNVGAYAAQVAEGSAGNLTFSMDEKGDIVSNMQNVASSGIVYDAGGEKETHLKTAAADAMSFGMKTEGEDCNIRLDAQGASATGIHYVPLNTQVDEVGAETFHVNMLDNAEASEISLGMTGATAKGIHYDTGGEKETHVASAGAKTLDLKMAGEGKDSKIEMLATGAGASGIDYVPMGVHVDEVSAGTVGAAMFDDNPDVRGDASAMAAFVTDASAKGIHYGKQGTDGYVGVKSVSSEHMDVLMGSSGKIKADVGKTSIQGIKQGDTKHGKGTTIRSVTADGIHGTMDGDNITAQVGEFDVGGLNSRDYGARASRIRGEKLGYSQDDEGKSLTLEHLGMGALSHASSGTEVTSSSLGGIRVQMPNKGDMSVDVATGKLKGVSHEQGGAGQADFHGLSMNMGEGGIRGAVDDFRATDLVHHSSGTTVGEVEALDLGFRQDEDGVKGSVGLADVVDLKSNGAEVDRITALGASGGMNNDGIISSDVESVSVYGASYDADGTKASMAYGNFSGIEVRDVDVSGDDIKGDMDIASTTLEDLVLDKDGHHVETDVVTAGGLFGSLDGSGGAVAGMDKMNVGKTTYTGDDGNASFDHLDLGRTRAALSGLSKGGTPALDGLSIADGSISGIDMDADVGKMLREAGVPEPLLGLVEPNPDFKIPELDNTRVDLSHLEHLKPDLSPPSTIEPGSNFEADAMAGASGGLSLGVPIAIDLTDYYLGTLRANATITMTARNGKVMLSDMHLDLSWLEDVADAANEGSGFAAGVSIGDYGLDITSSGQVAIWFDVDTNYFGKRFAIDVFDASDYGAVNGGAWGVGDYVSLQKLAESMGSSQPTVRTVEETESGTMEDLRENIDAAEEYIDVGNVVLTLKGLKAGNGHMGNESWGFDFTDSDKAGVNEVNGSVWVGGGGSVSADDLRMKDVHMAGDKPLDIDSANIQGLGATFDAPTGFIEGNGSVKSTIDKVSVRDVTYGDDLSTDPRFKRRGE